MLADAIRAETWRLVHNRTTVFWSALFLPVIGVVMAVIGNTVMKSGAARMTVQGDVPPQLAQMLTGGPVRVIEEIISSVGEMANPAVLLFMLIGAAALYSGDYRWETWRLISARNSRTNLILGKVATLGLLALAAMIALLAGEIAEVFIKAMILERPVSWVVDANAAGRFAALFGLSWLAIMQFTLVALLAAVTTRSLLAAMFVPIVVGAVQTLSPQGLAAMGIEPDAWIAVLINPGLGFSLLQAWVSGASGLPDQAVMKALATVGLWLVWPLAAALALFQRQDLSKE